ncbi:hypothetical protein AVEN_203145-1 [Araneus ventricosus]|uniref:Transposase Tc1-like domain-containing protein n=1 Tax=Araneus ventricosus TaxID=182803 RepID=A0A4Y2RF94_ARAVE|nr:hypothetical protein AVEN_203145-1 [Araneus ventricosus]
MPYARQYGNLKQLGIVPGTERKRIPSSSVEGVAIAVVEASSLSPHGSASVPVFSRVLDMPYSTVRRILRRILNIYPYKIKSVHLLQDGDSEVRTIFALEFLRSNGHVNILNCRIWVAEKPHSIQEHPLHPDKITVWCGFMATFIIGPYF